MQDPIQPNPPVDPQTTVLPVTDQSGQVTDQSVVAQQVLATDQPIIAQPAMATDPTLAVDPQTSTPQPPQPGDSPPDQNPLDVLESILAEAKQKAGQKVPAGEVSGGGDPVASTSTTTTDPASPPAPPPPTPEEIAAQEAAHQAEIEQQKQQLMAQISQTPEYQAKVQQDAEKAEEETQSAAGGDGFQIQQLQHTKI